MVTVQFSRIEDSRMAQGDLKADGLAIVEKYWWHVNKTGFPIKEATWKKMWDYIIAIHPDGADIAMSICGKAYKRIPTPSLPVVSVAYTTQENMLAVQRYMEELQYNHTGTQFFEIKKTRSLSRLGGLISNS